MLCVFLFSFSLLSKGQDAATDSLNYVRKDFLILLSTKSYSSALTTAKRVSSTQKIKLDLRGLKEHKEAGLTLSKEECAKAEEDYPAYYARGRWDDGVYVSIEYSDAYSGFAKGYYIVVAASGSREEPTIKTAWTQIKKTYKDAYFKSSDVYVGCMH